MGFIGLFNKKGIPIKSSSGLGAGLNVPKASIPTAKPLPIPPQARGKPPEDLPKFPVNNRFPEKSSSFNPGPNSLPRLESEHSMKDFVTPGRRPFAPSFDDIEPFEAQRPTTLDKLEGDFKPTNSLYKGDIKPIDRPSAFDLHESAKRRPLFIRTDQFKDVKENMLGVKESLAEVDEIHYRINNLNDDQESQLNLFHNKIEEIQRKLIFVDKTIFEKGD